jgi:hypothetical protein
MGGPFFVFQRKGARNRKAAKRTEIKKIDLFAHIAPLRLCVEKNAGGAPDRTRRPQ